MKLREFATVSMPASIGPRATCSTPSPEDAGKYGVRAAFLSAQPTTSLLKELTTLLDRGQIKTHVDKVFPLEQARQAQNLKRHGHIHGKIVLKIADQGK